MSQRAPGQPPCLWSTIADIQEALDTIRTRSDARNARATPQVGRNRRWQLNLFDPDGTRVELMEPWTIK